MAGVADQRPSRSPGAPEEAGATVEGPDADRRRRPIEAGCDLGCRLGKDPPQDLDAAGADAARLCRGEHARLPGVGRDDAGRDVVAIDPLVTIGVEVGPVAVHDGGLAGSRAFDRRADTLSDGGPDTVRAD